MITVDEFMTSEPCTLHESDTVREARKIMTDRHIRHIPVTDKDDHVIGLVTQRDVLAVTGPGAAGKNKKTTCDERDDIKLSEVMIKKVSVIEKTDSLRKAALYMQSHKYGCLPVIADGRLVGIITDSDFVSIAIDLIEQAEMYEAEMADDEAFEDYGAESLD